MNAAEALSNLTEISSQIRAAVVTRADGEVLGSTLADGDRSRRLAAAARELVAAVDEVRGRSETPIVQLEAATSEGSVFVVREGELLVAATTTPEPTVGLVFYDLKTCLRDVAHPEGEEAKPRPAARKKPAKAPAEEEETDGRDDARTE